MKFYNRKNELDVLNSTYNQIDSSGKMLVITGRRRVGKTLLSLEFIKDKPRLYLFVSKKSELLLCKEFLKQIQQQFTLPVIGELNTFKEVFALLLEISKQQPFILVVDEFQEFQNINSSVFSELQMLWDLNKSTSKIQVIFMGSVYSLMHKIFEGAKEPLFGRADYLLHLHPFSPSEIYCILKDYKEATVETLFNYYIYTGGIPKYIDILVSNNIFTEQGIIDFMLSPISPFLNEGKEVLIEEFGKNYAIYFSILELISVGKTSRSELESILQKDIGGYLERLDSDYGVLSKFNPITAKPNARLQKYHIKDNFLRFWFRFIYRNRTAVETQNFDYIKQIIKRDIKTYKGKMLEKLFYDLFAESRQFNKIGSYWNRRGTDEIDLIGINDLEKKMVVSEIKLNKDKISLEKLKHKAAVLVGSFGAYDIQYKALSLSDIVEYIRTKV